MFDIDFKVFSFRALPSFLRKTIFVQWGYLLVHHIGILQSELLSFRAATKEKITWGRSKLSVETLIRQKFNETQISLITQIVDNEEFMVFPPEYSALTPFIDVPDKGKVKVRLPNDFIDLEKPQLLVQVPLYLQIQEDAIRAFLKDYLHVGIIYKIDYI